MPDNTEIELKFQVPAASRAALLAEMSRGQVPAARTTLAASYLDTPDRRLARAGIAWRVRREGRRWVQTLKAKGSNPLERFEHEVILADPTFDAGLHAGTPAGEQLLRELRKAGADGADVGVRFQTSVRRTSRRLRTRGAVVEVAFDEGRLVADTREVRIREVEFELVSGSPVAMVALAQRWQRKFSLVYDPRSKAERGDRLADGSPFPPLRKAGALSYGRDATALQAFGAVLDECLAHICRNAIGLADGDPDQRVEHVHQMRVGIRRLRSALRCLEGWAPAPPPQLVEDVRGVFATLGQVREADVLGSGVAADLARAGAPPLAGPPPAAGPDPAEVARSPATQHTLLAWIGWRMSLAEAGPHPVAPQVPAPARPAGAAPAARSAAGTAVTGPPHQDHSAASQAPGDDPRGFRRLAQKRLRKWHRGLADDCARFDELDENALHSLRKRIKRQRYAVEFFAPVLRRKGAKRYIAALTPIQDRMGELNDVFVARGNYQALAPQEPGAWFALGWLAARARQLREQAGRELQRAVKVDSPATRR